MKTLLAPSALYIFIILLSTFACEQKSIPEPEQTINWEQHSIFNNALGLMNSASFNSQLSVLMPSSVVKDFSISNSEGEVFNFGLSSGIGRLKFPLAENYFVYSNLDKVIVKSTATNSGQSVEKLIDLKTWDAEFNQLIDIPYWQGACMAINESDYLLVPYQAVRNGKVVNTPRFLLTKIIPPILSDTELEVESVKVIDLEIFYGAATVYGVQAFFDFFYVRMGPYTYQISIEGDVAELSAKWFNIFQHGNILHAFASEDHGVSVEYLQSWDQGNSWEIVGILDDPNNGTLFGLSYVEIDERIVGYGKGQLFELVLSDGAYQLVELNSQGLGLADITSISMANDSTVFITSRCNDFSDKCGGFYTPLVNFFD